MYEPITGIPHKLLFKGNSLGRAFFGELSTGLLEAPPPFLKGNWGRMSVCITSFKRHRRLKVLCEHRGKRQHPVKSNKSVSEQQRNILAEGLGSLSCNKLCYILAWRMLECKIPASLVMNNNTEYVKGPCNPTLAAESKHRVCAGRNGTLHTVSCQAGAGQQGHLPGDRE